MPVGTIFLGTYEAAVAAEKARKERARRPQGHDIVDAEFEIIDQRLLPSPEPEEAK